MLPAETLAAITAAVNQLFDSVANKFFGPFAGPKRLILGYRREMSLPGIYESSLIQERGTPNKDTLQSLIGSASNYLEGERHRALAQVINAVQGYLGNRSLPDQDPQELLSVMTASLSDIFWELKYNVRRLVDTESQRAKAVGSLEGIIRANAAMGNDDPVVFLAVVHDKDLCDECKRLHLMPDEITPRLYYLSELSHAYHKKGDDTPSVSGEHPHCRCSVTTLINGFGFNGSGAIEWRGEGHSEIDLQRGNT